MVSALVPTENHERGQSVEDEVFGHPTRNIRIRETLSGTHRQYNGER